MGRLKAGVGKKVDKNSFSRQDKKDLKMQLYRQDE